MEKLFSACGLTEALETLIGEGRLSHAEILHAERLEWNFERINQSFLSFPLLHH